MGRGYAIQNTESHGWCSCRSHCAHHEGAAIYASHHSYFVKIPPILVIYWKSPIGLPVPPVLKQAGLTAEDAEGLNRLLQELAWEAAIHHPLSGVKAL